MPRRRSVPPGSLVKVLMFVVPLHPPAELEHLPFSGPQVNSIVPIGVLSGKPITVPIAYNRSWSRTCLSTVGAVRGEVMANGLLLDQPHLEGQLPCLRSPSGHDEGRGEEKRRREAAARGACRHCSSNPRRVARRCSHLDPSEPAQAGRVRVKTAS